MNQERGDHGIRVRLHESTRADDSAAGTVDSSLFPEWPHRSGHDVRSKLSRRENATFHRAWLAELDGRAVGRMVVSSSWWHDRSDPVYVTLNVHRDFQGRGVGTVLWARLAHALAPHPSTEISLMVRDDDARSMDIVHRLGFTKKMTRVYCFPSTLSKENVERLNTSVKDIPSCLLLAFMRRKSQGTRPPWTADSSWRQGFIALKAKPSIIWPWGSGPTAPLSPRSATI